MCFSMLAQCIAFAFQDMGPELFGFLSPRPPLLTPSSLSGHLQMLSAQSRGVTYICVVSGLFAKDEHGKTWKISGNRFQKSSVLALQTQSHRELNGITVSPSGGEWDLREVCSL